MPPVVRVNFDEYVADIDPEKIIYQNFKRDANTTDVFNDISLGSVYRMDVQHITTDAGAPNPTDKYHHLAVQLNRGATKKKSRSQSGALKGGKAGKGETYATLLVHQNAAPDVELFKTCLLNAGAKCHEEENGHPIVYCVRIEPDGSWVNKHTQETGTGGTIANVQATITAHRAAA